MLVLYLLSHFSIEFDNDRNEKEISKLIESHTSTYILQVADLFSDRMSKRKLFKCA